MSKEFSLAVGRASEKTPDDAMPFRVEGSDAQLYAYPPTEGQLALIMGTLAGGSLVDRAASVLDIFWSLLDEDTEVELRRRLRDRNDPFTIQDVLNIMDWVIEEVTGRPTKSSSDSTPSPPTNGRRSTGSARPAASTRSRSPRTASAT